MLILDCLKPLSDLMELFLILESTTGAILHATKLPCSSPLRDHKTVCRLSCFISSQGQREKTFASWRTDSFEKEARLVEVCMSGCSGKGTRETIPTGHWMRCPSSLVMHSYHPREVGGCSGPKLCDSVLKN